MLWEMVNAETLGEIQRKYLYHFADAHNLQQFHLYLFYLVRAQALSWFIYISQRLFSAFLRYIQDEIMELKKSIRGEKV